MKQSITISRKDNAFTFYENTFNRQLGYRNKEEMEILFPELLDIPNNTSKKISVDEKVLKAYRLSIKPTVRPFKK